MSKVKSKSKENGNPPSAMAPHHGMSERPLTAIELIRKLTMYRPIPIDDQETYVDAYVTHVEAGRASRFDFKSWAFLPPRALLTTRGLERLLVSCGFCAAQLNVESTPFPDVIRTTNWNYHYVPSNREVKAGYSTQYFMDGGSYFLWSIRHEEVNFLEFVSSHAALDPQAIAIVEHSGTFEHPHVEVFHSAELFAFKTANLFWRWAAYRDDHLVFRLKILREEMIPILASLRRWYKKLMKLTPIRGKGSSRRISPFLIEYEDFVVSKFKSDIDPSMVLEYSI